MKRDPLGMIDGPNMYGYVGGNPVMYSDPDGRFIVLATLTGVAALIAGLIGIDLWAASELADETKRGSEIDEERRSRFPNENYTLYDTWNEQCQAGGNVDQIINRLSNVSDLPSGSKNSNRTSPSPGPTPKPFYFNQNTVGSNGNSVGGSGWRRPVVQPY